MRYLSVFTLLAASATFLSAASITQVCANPDTPAIVNGAIMPTVAVCAGFNPGSGGLITHLDLALSGSFDAPADNVEHRINFYGDIDFDLLHYGYGGVYAGPADAHATTGGLPTTILSNNYSLASIGPILVQVSVVTDGLRPLPSDAKYTVYATYTYNPGDTFNLDAVPEPSTLLLVGGVLLVGLRKLRR